jgi:hypothetical protein
VTGHPRCSRARATRTLRRASLDARSRNNMGARLQILGRRKWSAQSRATLAPPFNTEEKAKREKEETRRSSVLAEAPC